MKAIMLGAFATAGLVIVVFGTWGDRSELFAQRSEPSHQTGTGGDLIVVSTPVGEKSQILTVIDPKLQAMCVYSIDLQTGKIALRSVRNIRWDLQMLYLNNESPLPQEIRTLLEQR